LHGAFEAGNSSQSRATTSAYAIGLLLQHSGEWKQSIPELEGAIRLKSNYASAHYRLAFVLERRYSGQEAAETEARLRSVTMFIVNTH